MTIKNNAVSTGAASPCGAVQGGATIAALRRIDPDVPLFAASGHADDPLRADPVRSGFTGSIRLPFTREERAAKGHAQ